MLDEQRNGGRIGYVAAWKSAFLASKNLTEGITAMFDKRAPEFKGE